MKKKNLTFVTILTFVTMSLFAQEKTEKFKVYGNCGMCESRIEKAARSVEGVTAADWEQETQMIEVTFDASKTDLQEIHKAIAGAGHDTDMFRAEDRTYEELPGCCHYERPAGKVKSEENDDNKH